MSLTIKVDASRLQQTLSRLEAALRDRRGMLEAIAAWLRRTIDRSFAEQRSPEGKPWAPLSFPYARLKGRGRILERSGRLRRSVRVGIEGDTVFARSDVPYAAAHQFGYTFPARRLEAEPGKTLRFFDAGLNTVFARHVQIPRRRLPSRPFLPSPETVEREATRIVEKRIISAVKGVP